MRYKTLEEVAGKYGLTVDLDEKAQLAEWESRLKKLLETKQKELPNARNPSLRHKVERECAEVQDAFRFVSQQNFLTKLRRCVDEDKQEIFEHELRKPDSRSILPSEHDPEYEQYLELKVAARKKWEASRVPAVDANPTNRLALSPSNEATENTAAAPTEPLASMGGLVPVVQPSLSSVEPPRGTAGATAVAFALEQASTAREASADSHPISPGPSNGRALHSDLSKKDQERLQAPVESALPITITTATGNSAEKHEQLATTVSTNPASTASASGQSVDELQTETAGSPPGIVKPRPKMPIKREHLSSAFDLLVKIRALTGLGGSFTALKVVATALAVFLIALAGLVTQLTRERSRLNERADAAQTPPTRQQSQVIPSASASSESSKQPTEKVKPSDQSSTASSESAKPLSEPPKPASEIANPSTDPVQPPDVAKDSSEMVKPPPVPAKNASEIVKQPSEPANAPSKPVKLSTESPKPPDPTNQVSEPAKQPAEVAKQSADATDSKDQLSENARQSSESQKPPNGASRASSELHSKPSEIVNASTEAQNHASDLAKQSTESPKPPSDMPQPTAQPPKQASEGSLPFSEIIKQAPELAKQMSQVPKAPAETVTPNLIAKPKESPAPDSQPKSTTPPRPKIQLALLRIESTPANASITIRGTKQPLKTPAEFNLMPGDYDIALALDCYTPISTTLHLEGGENRVLTRQLQSLQPALAVRTLPPGAKIYVDGAPRNQLTPATITGIDPGDRWVTVELPGYRSQNMAIKAKCGETVPVDFGILQRPTARVSVTSNARGASVWIDGSDSGQTTPCSMELPLGTHRLRLVGPQGYRPEEKSFYLQGEDSVRLDVPLTPELVAIPANNPSPARIDPPTEYIPRANPNLLVWCGLDYSMVKMIGSSRDFPESEIFPNSADRRGERAQPMTSAWNELFMKEMYPRLSRELRAIVQADLRAVESRNARVTSQQIVHEEGPLRNIGNLADIGTFFDPARFLHRGNKNLSTHVSDADIAAAIRSYRLQTRSGLGLVFIMDQLVKRQETSCMYVVFFDIASRTIVSQERVCTDAGGGGIRNHWFGSIKETVKRLPEMYQDAKLKR